MRVLIFTVGLGLSWILVATTCAETVESGQAAEIIPLKEVWGFAMPGTRDVLSLEANKVGAKPTQNSASGEQTLQPASMSRQIANSLSRDPSEKPARLGFAVQGTGAEALREAHAVLVDGRKPRDAFSVNSNISLVFFSKIFDDYIQFDKIERRGKTITIKYYFVPYRGDPSSHFALIPLGELTAGEVTVEVIRVPIPDTPEVRGIRIPAASWDTAIVSRSYTFKAEETSDK